MVTEDIPITDITPITGIHTIMAADIMDAATLTMAEDIIHITLRMITIHHTEEGKDPAPCHQVIMKVLVLLVHAGTVTVQQAVIPQQAKGVFPAASLWQLIPEGVPPVRQQDQVRMLPGMKVQLQDQLHHRQEARSAQCLTTKAQTEHTLRATIILG